MKRHPFNLAVWISLLLFVATAVLWVRSYWMSDAITYGSGNGMYGAQSAAGSIALVAIDLPSSGDSIAHGSSGVDDNSVESHVNWRGVNYTRNPLPFTSPRTQSLPEIVYPLASTALFVPFWTIAAVFLLAPLCGWVMTKRNRWM